SPLFGRTATVGAEPQAVYRLHGANTSIAFVGVTPENLRTVITHHETHIAWLNALCKSLGHEPRTAWWTARNWRVLTLRALSGRMSSGQAPVPLSEHLRSVMEVRGSLIKRTALALVILFIRTAPLRVACYAAGTIIQLHYM